MPRARSATVDPDRIMVAVESFHLNVGGHPMFIEKGSRLRASGVPTQAPAFFCEDGADSLDVLRVREALGQKVLDRYNDLVPAPEPQSVTLRAIKGFSAPWIGADGKQRILVVNEGDLYASESPIAQSFGDAFEPVE